MGYQLGQEILPLEEPFSHVVNYKYRSKFCDWCIQAEEGSEAKLKKCTCCKEVYYCNRACQQKAYTTYHKKECKKLKTIPSFIASERRDVLILMGRTITKIQNGGDQASVKLPNGVERKFDDLMSHEDEIAHVHKDLIAPFKKPWCQKWFGDVSFEYLLRLFGKITINQHGLYSSTCEVIGPALYIGASVFDHACSPNAVCITKNGKSISIRAIENIESFSDVRICYIGPEDTDGRKKELKEHYHFDCKCQLCEDEVRDSLMSSVKCPKYTNVGDKESKNDPFPHCVPIKTGKCVKCGTLTSNEILEKYQRLKTAITIDSDDLNYAEWLIEAHTVFHPYDTTYHEFAQKCTRNMKFLMARGHEQDEDTYISLNMVMVIYVQKYFRKYDPIRAQIYFLCSDNLFQCVPETPESLQIAIQFLAQGLEVFEVSHGVDHPQFKIMKQKFCS